MEFDARYEANESLKDSKLYLKSCRVVESGVGWCSVVVETLEGHVMQVKVTEEGWKVQDHDHHDDEGFETLHALLTHHSPEYRKAFGSSLFSKLSSLATTNNNSNP